MSAQTEYRYNRLTWPEMNDAIEMQKLVILPTGSTEQHGRHLPLDRLSRPLRAPLPDQPMHIRARREYRDGLRPPQRLADSRRVLSDLQR